MNQLNRVRSLSGAERYLFALALLLVLSIRIALLVVPYRLLVKTRRRLRRRLNRLSPRFAAGPAEIGAAVRRASRLVPGATCMPQALAAEFLLDLAGHNPWLRLGVAIGAAGETLAHAWVESAGQVVIGGPVHEFVPLTAALPGRR